MKKRDLGSMPNYKSARKFFNEAVQKSLYPESVRQALIDAGLLKQSEPVTALLNKMLELEFDLAGDQENSLAMALLKVQNEPFPGIGSDIFQTDISVGTVKTFITMCSVCRIDYSFFSEKKSEIMIQTSAINVLGYMALSLKIVDKSLVAICFVPDIEEGQSFDNDYSRNEDGGSYVSNNGINYINLNITKFVIF